MTGEDEKAVFSFPRQYTADGNSREDPERVGGTAKQQFMRNHPNRVQELRSWWPRQMKAINWELKREKVK
jgi:hypothetical protein